MTSHRPTKPRFPFFKDETGRGRLSSHITLKTSVRVLIVGFMVGAVLIAAVVWWAVLKVNELDTLSSQRHQDNLSTQAQIEKVVAQNKQDAFNAVAHLACSVVALYPPGTSVFIDNLSKTYGCPPYQSSPLASATPSAGGQNPGLNPGQSSAHNSPSPHAAGPALSPTVDKTVDKPSATPTPSAPTSAAPTPLIDLAPVTCRVLGLLC